MAKEDFFETTVTGEAGSQMAAEALPASQPMPASQPQPVGDSRLAAILQRKEAGEKLSAADRGYLGAVKRRGSPKKVAPAASENILLEAPAVADNELFGRADVADEPAARVVATVVDSALLRSTANAILNSVDTVTKIYVGHEAKQAGANEQTVEQYKSAVALQVENRQLMVENSEPVVLGLCKLFKCSPENLEKVLKSSGFIGGAAMHTLGVITAIKSIRESRKEKEAAK